MSFHCLVFVARSLTLAPAKAISKRGGWSTDKLTQLIGEGCVTQEARIARAQPGRSGIDAVKIVIYDFAIGRAAFLQVHQKLSEKLE